MAATVTIRVNTGAAAATESGAQTGIDLISADNATNSPANRSANPITASSSTTLYVGKTATGVTPTSADSTVATNAWTTYQATGKFAWHATKHATNMTGVASTTDFAVFQLDVDSDAAAGNWTQETINYSYDEA
jgi:hypothetical protein